MTDRSTTNAGNDMFDESKKTAQMDLYSRQVMGFIILIPDFLLIPVDCQFWSGNYEKSVEFEDFNRWM